MAIDVDVSLDIDEDQRPEREEPASYPSNIILIGATGAGKSTTGWLLARLIGFGFIDVDQAIEAREQKAVQAIFDEKGEGYFRQLETDLLRRLQGLRSHVVSVGGGAVVEDESWQCIEGLGTIVWINTPPEEIARRLLANEVELKKRPLLAEVLSHKDAEMRHKLLSERIKALIGNRVSRYRQARLMVADSFSTPESTAHLVKEALVREGLLTVAKGQSPLDRWRSL